MGNIKRTGAKKPCGEGMSLVTGCQVAKPFYKKLQIKVRERS